MTAVFVVVGVGFSKDIISLICTAKRMTNFLTRNTGNGGAHHVVKRLKLPMTNLTAICLCVLIWASCPEPVPRKLFDAVSENTGLDLEYGNPEHEKIVRELLREVFKNDSK
jgi:hypothetical protein